MRSKSQCALAIMQSTRPITREDLVNACEFMSPDTTLRGNTDRSIGDINAFVVLEFSTFSTALERNMIRNAFVLACTTLRRSLNIAWDEDPRGRDYKYVFLY